MTDQGDPNPTPSAPAAPAGWYDDPSTGGKRWWDGTAWGDAPTPPPPPAAQTTAPAAAPSGPKPPTKPLALIALIVGGVAFLLGLIPGLGLILAIAGIALAIVALIRKQTPRWMPIVGGAASGVALLTGIIVIAVVASGGVRTPNVASSPTPTEETQVEETTEPVAEVEVPDVVGLPTEDAAAAIIAAGLKVERAGESGTVASTDPAAGTTVEEGTTVTLTSQINLATFYPTDANSFALIAKNPDAYIGTNLIFYGAVTQFDSATGPCTMRMNAGAAQTTYSYEYDANTIVISGENDVCPVLDPIVQDDHVQVYATVLGAFDYDTAIGGTATAILVQAYAVTKLAPQEF